MIIMTSYNFDDWLLITIVLENWIMANSSGIDYDRWPVINNAMVYSGHGSYPEETNHTIVG